MPSTRAHIILAASAGLAVSAHAQVINENFDSTPTGTLPAGWVDGTIAGGVMMPWAVTTAAFHSPFNSVFTDDPASVSDRTLALPPFVSQGVVTLDFWSSYATENTFDGWTVEISLNGGAFTNIGDAPWTLNGYNNTISTAWQSPIGGQRAFYSALVPMLALVAALVLFKREIDRQDH